MESEEEEAEADAEEGVEVLKMSTRSLVTRTWRSSSPG